MSDKKVAQMTDDQISEIMNIPSSHVHNLAKRGFNIVVDELLEANKEMTIVDLMTQMMHEFDLDEYTITRLLNKKNKARLALTLTEMYKLRTWGNVSDDLFNKWTKQAENK